MAKIIYLDVKNYRGIKDLSLEFKLDQDLICLIGRGDSGKSTILDAISSILSPIWNLNFYDTDFYNCDHKNDIEIVISLIDIPEKLLSENKFGLYIRGLNKQNGEIIDDVILEELSEDITPVLTIKLTVDTSLEPQWVVTTTREQEDKPISGADRAYLSCHMISDYVDRHLSWNKGNPLYALLKSTNPDKASDDHNVVLQSLREAKEVIDKNGFGNLDEVTALIKSQAAGLGLNISEVSTTLDSKEISIKDGRISLHENAVPFRQKGKGSKRLSSMAIQSVLVRNGGIMLIDEVEQGLEPDRVKQVVRALKEHHAGQIFMTTHSRDVITELGSEPLLFLLKNKKTDDIEKRFFDLSHEDLQKTIRACPEAFFAKKVIVCEGATEVGICRALDKWRRNNNNPQMSFKDCAYIDGAGRTIMQRVDEINKAGIKTALFCDSDREDINEKKQLWKAEKIDVFDCDDKLCLEQQVFKDLAWVGVKELMDYVLLHHKKNVEQSLIDSIKAKYSDNKNFPTNWKDSDNNEMRDALGSSAKTGEWFKAVHHGEAMGDIIFKYLEQINNSAHLKTTLEGLSRWIDE